MSGKKNIVLLDTNALFIPFQFGMSLDTEIRRLAGNAKVMIPSAVASELRAMSRRKHLAEARRLSLKYDVAKCPKAKTADEAILLYAKTIGASVVTCDRKLVRALVSAGLRALVLRGKTHLVSVPSD